MIDRLLNNEHIPLLIGYLLAILSIVALYTIMFVGRKRVLDDLRGKDKMWQFVELTAIIWMILMPTMVICDLLGVHASTYVWTSMDAIYLINVGGKVTSKYFESRKGDSSNSAASSTEDPASNPKI